MDFSAINIFFKQRNFVDAREKGDAVSIENIYIGDFDESNDAYYGIRNRMKGWGDYF